MSNCNSLGENCVAHTHARTHACTHIVQINISRRREIKIFFELSHTQENYSGVCGGTTILNPVYPRLPSGDIIIQIISRLIMARLGETHLFNKIKRRLSCVRPSGFCLIYSYNVTIYFDCLLEISLIRGMIKDGC